MYSLAIYWVDKWDKNCFLAKCFYLCFCFSGCKLITLTTSSNYISSLNFNHLLSAGCTWSQTKLNNQHIHDCENWVSPVNSPRPFISRGAYTETDNLLHKKRSGHVRLANNNTHPYTLVRCSGIARIWRCWVTVDIYKSVHIDTRNEIQYIADY